MEIEPPASVSPAVFTEWRNARRGHGQAQDLTNPLWTWLAETGHEPYVVNQHFGGPPSFEAGPGWTHERFGQSTTELPDGRTVSIGGEHEDYYDPDFYIYNDVIVQHPGGRVEILGYDEATFPPTDFHTASLVDDRIVLVGNLGYKGRRHSGVTQMLELDTETWHVRALSTSGDNPGWIHGHTTTVTGDGTLLVTGGQIWIDDDTPSGALLLNPDDWELDAGRVWHRRTDRRWQQWRIDRPDGEPSSLWQHRTAALSDGINDPTSGPLADLYALPVAHRRLRAAGADEFNVVRIAIDETTLRFAEDMGGLSIVVEGDLSTATVDLVIGHLRTALAALDNRTHVARRLR